MQTNRWKAGLLGLALLAGLGVVGPLLVAPYIPLVDPDEGLHASIAQEMVESGDWTVPRLLKEPFLDKPILYFWAIAASLKVFGMSEAAVRLPGVLFGLLGTLTTAAVAWRMLGRRTGIIAGVFYASMILPLALVQLPAHDVALVPWINLALLCFWESDVAGSPGKRGQSPFADHEYMVPAALRVLRTNGDCPLFPAWRAWAWCAAAGVVLGMAILTKGLAGVALVGVAYGSYLIAARRLRFIHCFRAALALTIAAMIGSSWYLAVEHANPGYLRYYFFERHVLGFLTSTQPHGAVPMWYYLPILIAGGIPWVGYLPVLVHDAFIRWRKRIPAVADARGNRPLLLLVCWFVGCTLFLTVSRSKLVTYIWPVFPAMAILAAIVWTRKMECLLTEGARRTMGRIVWFTCLIGPLGLPATFLITQNAMPVKFSMAAWAVAIGAGLTSLAPLVSWRRGRDRLTLALASATVCGQLVVVLLCAVPPVAAGLSARDMAAYFNRTRNLPSRMLMAQERVGSVIFYLDHDLRSQLQLGQIANQDIDDPLPTPPVDMKEWIVVPDRHLPTALKDYDLLPLPCERAGRFRIFQRSDVEPRVLVGQADAPLLR